MEQSRTFRAADGAVIAYRLWRSENTRARRRLLVLLHGLGSNLTRWSEFVARTSLRDAWDLLRMDLRGSGGSLWRGRVDAAVWCADLAALLAQEGYASAVLAGHCLGANLALEFAHRHPARTDGLILIEPMLPGALSGTLRRVARLRPLFRVVIAVLRAGNALGFYRRRLTPLDLEELDRETRAAIRATGSTDVVERHGSAWLDLMTTPSAMYLQALLAVSGSLPDLAGIRAPALALLSSGTTFTDPVLTDRLLRVLPGCRVVRLDARHWIPTERPEAMRTTIDAWCAALPTA